MSRTAAISKAEIERTVKGVIAAGLPVARVVIDKKTGNIIIFTGGPDDKGQANEWDDVQ